MQKTYTPGQIYVADRRIPEVTVERKKLIRKMVIKHLVWQEEAKHSHVSKRKEKFSQ